MVRRGAVRTLAVVAAAGLLACSAPRIAIPRAPNVEAQAEPRVYDDDFEAARAEAKRRNVPIFVDAWAPWCHTCLAMRANVLADASLRAERLPDGRTLGEAFVWASVDTEKPKNQAFVAKYPNRSWPTLFVLSPDGETARLVWGGSATRAELVSLLVDVASTGESPFARATRLAALGRTKEARAAFEAVVDDAQEPLVARARAVEGLVGLPGMPPEDVLAVAHGALEWLPRGTSRAVVLAAALEALGAKKEKAPRLLAQVRAEAKPICGKAPCEDPMADDDRSSLYEALCAYDEAVGDAPAKDADAAEWLATIEATRAAATSAEARLATDAHLLLAAEAANRVARVVPALEASARDFPTDGNTHARLARAKAALGDWEAAVSEGRRAMTHLEGPRLLRVAGALADALEKLGRPREAREALDLALRRTAKLALTERQRALADTLVRRRDAFGPSPAPP